MTAVISSVLISGIVTSERGWKHITRHVPLAGSNLNSSSDSPLPSGHSGSREGKSLLNTKVDVYSGLVPPLGLQAPGQSGLLGSNLGIAASSTASTCPLHGLCKRWGDTKIHSPFKGLYLTCWCSKLMTINNSKSKSEIYDSYSKNMEKPSKFGFGSNFLPVKLNSIIQVLSRTLIAA